MVTRGGIFDFRMGYQRDLETTVHMHLYSVKKVHVFSCILIFMTIMFLSITAGILGPSVLTRNNHYATKILPEERTIYNGFYKVTSDPVMLFQREIWFSSVIHQENPNAFMSIPVTVNISVMCRTYPKDMRNEGNSDPGAGEVLSIVTYQRNTMLFCNNGKACNELQLVHLALLNCTAYTFKVRFFGLRPQNNVEQEGDGGNLAHDADDMHEAAMKLKMADAEAEKPLIPAFEITEIEFITQTHNATFSYFELLLRFVAFLAAFGLLGSFCVSMRSFGWKYWTIEQKFTVVLLILLLFFYNPLHPLMYLLSGWIPQALDGFFQVSFYAFLLLFWLCVFDALRVADRSCCRFYCLRLIIPTLIWLVFVTFNGWVVHSEYCDPLFYLLHHSVAIQVFLALLGVLAFIYLLYFFILLFRSYSELRSMPYYNLRLTLLLIPVLLMAVNFLVVMGLRFNPYGPAFYLRPVTTEVATPFEGFPVTPSGAAFTSFRSALELTLNFSIVFCFALLMVIAYSPASTALAEANYKDDPSASLVYESDEDVLYGSDHDDIQLRRSVRSR
ncbi:Transmembrane protein [Echinococcus granulosus]|uniref:Transmembrane protein 181 n=1 Tax=Echinococcus granulosus TaxID=6210 RepID=A0A068X145_ECHGR|nr:Transmembrane protein [Echinococcus granulosus]CDS23647.1 transmembrane protein 181 [Echinococcus granulosus]